MILKYKLILMLLITSIAMLIYKAILYFFPLSHGQGSLKKQLASLWQQNQKNMEHLLGNHLKGIGISG